MKRQGDVRNILSANGIDYTVKVTNRQNAAVIGSSRARVGENILKIIIVKGRKKHLNHGEITGIA